MSLNLSTLPAATGYNTKETYYGTRFVQGGRTNYLLDLSLLQIMSLVPRPNPEVPTVGNRRINPKHASDFATYLRATPEWVVPGIILRTERPFEFEAATDEAHGVAFGAVSFQRSAVGEVHILDGQHRILGLYEALDGINADVAKISELIKKARRIEDGNAVAEFERQKAALETQAARFTRERIPVQIMVEADPQNYRQAFYDIAENAKGITASVRARFDSRKAVNRALEDILSHPLLANRVETETDRLPQKSPYFTTAKYVIETVRALTVGYEGRVGKRVEAQLNDKEIEKNAKDFFDSLVRAFPPLYQLQHGQITADDLRAHSLLGAPVFLRILAATRYELVTDHAFSTAMVEEFFKKLAPHLEVPIWEGSMLFEQIGMPSFIPGMSAPSSRRQDAVAVVDAFVGWAIDKPDFLNAAPTPRPAEAEFDFDSLTEEEADALLRPETAAARAARETGDL
ncbi:DNA sulfur modification protein DndB [Leifsonia aquatica]|uniref:DNA sulfur modification protein DndB n=1 Tax=Leifsonia aquatica TaxID=144185 RepID=UPI000467F208|nr:DNA sulfur modification protein DndB [Leifsonia aquatica]